MHRASAFAIIGWLLLACAYSTFSNAASCSFTLCHITLRCGSLTWYSPSICLTTSWLSDVIFAILALCFEALLSPSIIAVYSASLFVATPRYSLYVSIVFPLSSVSTIPIAAGPGFDLDAPSVYMFICLIALNRSILSF